MSDRSEADTMGTPMRRDLRAMNSDIELVCYAPDAPRRLDRAKRWLRAYESRFSRFRELSELSRLNRAAGRPYRVSPALFRLIDLALQLARRSGGVFDPTVLRDLELSGYDRSFELITGPSTAGRRSPAFSYRDVMLDPVARTVLLPEGSGIDLGGIGKGYAVDELARILGTPSLVNGGGDVFAAGRPHDAGAWLVGIADPFAPERDLCVLALCDRAVATSTTLRRRWTMADGEMRAHHLIDTRTHAPSQTDVVQASIVAPTALLADYHAKVALLLGLDAGLRYVNKELDVEGLLIGRDGRRHESAGLAGYLVAAPTD